MGLHVEKYHVVVWSTQSTTQKQTILLKVFVLFLGDKPFLEWSAYAQLYPRKISMHCMHKYASFLSCGLCGILKISNSECRSLKSNYY